MKLQAMFSAPRPWRSRMPATKMPIAQLVRIRLMKNAASARPRPHRLKPKNAIASSDTGTMPIDKPDDALDHQRRDELGRAQRAHHQVAEVAGVHLLEERDREAELAAEQDVPQHHRADEGAGGLREEAGVLRDVELQEAPHQHLHRRPVDQVEHARPGRAEQIPVAQHHRADAARRERDMGGRLHAHCAASRASPVPRAMSRNTSSRLLRP